MPKLLNNSNKFNKISKNFLNSHFISEHWHSILVPVFTYALIVLYGILMKKKSRDTCQRINYIHSFGCIAVPWVDGGFILVG